ncbi:alpha/beta fold hydrolase [Ruminococcus sp. zg-924]|nr:alpha/beta fold hydrolase [Ruminococcus sp. zg-924]MCQ4115711.1 alpha/beta fold hydrolase [Ruminococcus sp. zg-921]
MKRMECGINFRSPKNQAEYFEAYEKTMQLFCIEVQEEYVNTEFGKSYVIKAGNINNPPLVLLHAASCGSPIWYKNFDQLSKSYRLYAIDLIGETSKSLMKKKMKNPEDNAKWLDQTIEGLGLDNVNLCGLSIGGWNAANYAARYPKRVNKLVLISPVQTFAKMYSSYFFKIMKMGFHPTRENVESYIGWGSEKEGKLPDSIITQFTLSVMNMNSNASFPKWLNEKQLKSIDMPVLVLFGENEFAFDIKKAERRARKCIQHLEMEIVKDASHLIPVSKPEYINNRIMGFLED